MEKKCNKCNVVKDVSEFGKRKVSKDGLRNDCKECRKVTAKRYRENNKDRFKQYNENNKEKKKEYNKEYKEDNKEKIKEYNKRYNENNKEKIKENRKKYREGKLEYMNKYNKLPKVKEKVRKHYEANKEEINKKMVKYVKSRIKTDSLFRLKWSTRANIYRYLKDGKSKRTREVVGIDFKEFQDYLEVEYTEGMHLDHIIPLSWANNDEEVYILNHYSNFQIITAEENLAKKDTYCKSENLKKVLDNHNDLTKLNEIIERNSDKIK
jgi:hypothetical protein